MKVFEAEFKIRSQARPMITSVEEEEELMKAESGGANARWGTREDAAPPGPRARAAKHTTTALARPACQGPFPEERR